MSGRRREDYAAVLKCLTEELPRPLQMSDCMPDFESAIWSALSEVFPRSKLHGCNFHFTHAVWRKVQDLGLTTAYMRKDATYKFIRRMMALASLPAEQIPIVFLSIQIAAESGSEQLQSLVSYFNNTWIENAHWTPAAWSVFRHPIRTNNDIEGWHRRINVKARHAGLGLHKLLRLLCDESKSVDLQTKLVSEEHIIRDQRASFRAYHGRIFSAWDDYEEGTKTVEELLKQIAEIHGPVIPVTINN